MYIYTGGFVYASRILNFSHPNSNFHLFFQLFIQLRSWKGFILQPCTHIATLNIWYCENLFHLLLSFLMLLLLLLPLVYFNWWSRWWEASQWNKQRANIQEVKNLFNVHTQMEFLILTQIKIRYTALLSQGNGNSFVFLVAKCNREKIEKLN